MLLLLFAVAADVDNDDDVVTIIIIIYLAYIIRDNPIAVIWKMSLKFPATYKLLTWIAYLLERLTAAVCTDRTGIVVVRCGWLYVLYTHTAL